MFSADVDELAAFSTGTSVRLDFRPLFLGISASLFSSVAAFAFSFASLDAFSASAAFFSSASFFAFSSKALTVSSSFVLAFVSSSTCFLTSVAVAFSFFNNSLASVKTLSSSLAIPLIFSASVALISLSKPIVNLFNSALSTFAVGNADAGTSTEIGVLFAAFDFPESPLTLLSAFDAVFPLFWLSCDTGTFSALADIPPPKNINDATATLAAPKWYFLIEKRVTFSPFLYSYHIYLYQSPLYIFSVFFVLDVT